MTTTATQGTYGELLKKPGFQPFLWTQFLGAFNDNIYKMVVTFAATHLAAKGEGSFYLSLTGVVFVLPFLLFSGYAGHMADAFSKTRVLIVTKSFEILSMLLAIGAFASGRIDLLLGVLFLLSAQAAFFSPAKYGIVPEITSDADLSRANGLLEMSTFVAIVLGGSVSAFLFDAWKHEPWKMGVVMLVIAVLGSLTSLRIKSVPASGAAGPLLWNPFGEVIEGTRRIWRERPLWLTVLGISYFWFLGALFQLDMLLFGQEALHATDKQVGILWTATSIGIGIGSLLAGKLSGDKVELGMVPLGSIGMGVCAILTHFAAPSFGWCVVWLTLLGLSCGIFAVPLNAYLQQRGEGNEKGRLIATNNFMNMIGVILASGTLTLLHDKLHLTASQILLAAGVFTLIGTIYIVKIVPEFFIRFTFWMLTHSIYDIRIAGGENIPKRGGALMVSNHVSHIDGFLIGSCMQRFLRFMVWRPFFSNPALGWFLRKISAIPVAAGSRREMMESLITARKEIEAGHVVCIFAEGGITRTGNMLPFRRGFEKIADGMANTPVIPVHLGGVWGSIFSFEGGKFFWKWPKRFPFPVTVTFGKPIHGKTSAAAVRQAVQDLASQAACRLKEPDSTLPGRFTIAARRNWSALALADSTGKELTFGKALTGALLFAQWLRREHASETMIGLLLPSSVGGAIANLGVAFSGQAAVNLNFTAGKDAMSQAAAQCGLKTIVTSKVFLERAKVEEMPGMIFIEDILASFTAADKLIAAAKAKLAPRRWLASGITPDSLATVVFSSGSTGIPKGVMLSHFNIVSNADSVGQVYPVDERDCIVGVLPFFHSFGYTFTLWFPMLRGMRAAYHPNPMDAKPIGEITAKYKGSMLLTTPTFAMTYVRKCTKEEFASLRFVIVGAEKLRESVAAAFLEKFGLPMLEGYGCTEMSPVVAVNRPDFEEDPDNKQQGAKPGTVGHPIPGLAVRIVDPESFEPLAPGKEGLMLVNGPSRMIGYLNDEARTAAAMRDGWYITGDIGCVDEDGFVRITDRLARFSKIGGEMVPHLKIEEALAAICDGAPTLVVGVPDEARGERLIAIYTKTDATPMDLWKKLGETDLPKLWIPKRDSFLQVEALPTLGTGKTDLRAAKALAREFATRA